MKTRQEFEAWAIDHGYDIDESKIFGRLYHCDESIRALQVWQAATSRQEAKIKALVDALESFTKSDYIKKQHPVRYKNAVAALAAAKEIP